jgi:hypothetical protein
VKEGAQADEPEYITKNIRGEVNDGACNVGVGVGVGIIIVIDIDIGIVGDVVIDSDIGNGSIGGLEE